MIFDNLDSLRELTEQVLDSDVVVLLQSAEVLTQPRCLLELYAAVKAGIPIVSLVCSGKGYDFMAAEDHLLHLDTSLPVSNPSAVGVLEASGAPVLRVAEALWTSLPNATSVQLNSKGSESAIRAAVTVLIKAMQRAHATIAAPPNTAAWLDNRRACEEEALLELVNSSTIVGTMRQRMLHRVETMAAELSEARAAPKQRLSADGILGGMYEFVPNRESSTLGKGVRVCSIRIHVICFLPLKRCYACC